MQYKYFIYKNYKSRQTIPSNYYWADLSNYATTYHLGYRTVQKSK